MIRDTAKTIIFRNIVNYFLAMVLDNNLPTPLSKCSDFVAKDSGVFYDFIVNLSIKKSPFIGDFFILIINY